ncbi:hypothetical protein E6C70_00900 [Glaciibacter flavus]|uniref:Uncharacterized protein n=1 Tax=Orlajensenia flava TaxID=2565934 RepID=A0A4S4FZQ2_9MICO|nr:hypothetical protein [Glaciibacter flavus]THG36134.1 hypothetical protein E6C70_00900 [Glaciibacter flavus]
MTIEAEEAATIPLHSDAEIEQRVLALIGSANRRQVWLMFLDEADVQLPVIIPMADYPSAPYGGAAELFAARIAEVVEATDAAGLIVVWERWGGAESTEADRVWARELASACAAVEVSVRAQLISHRSGVRWFSPDDYL